MLDIAEFRVDHRSSPLDASLTPEFAWIFQADSVGEQKSYRLRVASTARLVDGDEADEWDSGFVESSRSFGIPYQGKALSFRHAYFVRLDVIDSEGHASSKTSSFETRLSPADWKGRWIGVPVSWNGGALGIRKSFDSWTKKVVRARAYIAGVGYHELYINGKKISDSLLNPGVTDYDKRVLYCSYDITPYLTEKTNVVGVLLGYGWYGNRKLLAQFYVDFEDGTTLEYHSECNGGWWFCKTPIIANSIYSGESYDARIEDEYPGGFTSPNLVGGYNEHWFGSLNTQPIVGELIPQEINPIRVLGRYPGSCLKEFSPRDLVYDVKQNIAGFCEIHVQGKRGAVIRLRHAETLKEDGHIDQTNLRSAACTDTYILKGKGEESYTPRFTYHGFRYVEVEIEGEAKLLSLTGLHVHSDNTKVGDFACADPDLNRLHKMAVITEENNEMSILTDCPQRDERFGWLNDVTTRVFQTCYNFDMDRFFNKVDRDISLCANSAGAITDTAPYYTGGQPADTSSLSYLLLALESYRYYGDLSTARENYRGHKAWVDYLLSRSKNYIMDYYYYADWVSCDNFPDGHSDGICISSLFLYWHLKTLAELALILSKAPESEHYASLAEEAKTALNAKYLHQDHFHEGTQCEDAMALSLGVIPEEKKAAVYAHLKASILSHDKHITCGNQGYRHVMYQLCEHGDIDLLLEVLKNPNYPGWGFMLGNDATTVWERWEKENQATMNSFDHPMFGSYDAIFYRYLLGIKIFSIKDNAIEISPQIPANLAFAQGHLDTPKGRIEVAWKRDGGEVVYDLNLPPNLKAELTLQGRVKEVNGEKVGEAPKLLVSGRYHIVTH